METEAYLCAAAYILVTTNDTWVPAYIFTAIW